MKKADLLEKLKPIAEEFADELVEEGGKVETAYQAMKAKEKEYLKLIEEKKVELEKAKEEVRKTRNSIERLKSDLATARDEARQATSRYEVMTGELNDKKREIVKLEEVLKTKKLIAEDNANATKIAKDSAEKEKEKYEKLLKILDKDVKSIDTEKAKLKTEWDKIESEKIDLERIKTDQLNESHRLNDLDLVLKAREYEVTRLIKRHQLEKLIGEKNGNV